MKGLAWVVRMPNGSPGSFAVIGRFLLWKIGAGEWSVVGFGTEDEADGAIVERLRTDERLGAVLTAGPVEFEAPMGSHLPTEGVVSCGAAATGALAVVR